MSELLGTLPGGLVSGAVYALLAMGLVLIYKATRVPNFAYGAMATFIAFFHYQLVSGYEFGFSLNVLFLHLDVHKYIQLPFWGAFPISLAFAALLGLVIERFIIRPFAKAPTVTMILVTLAVSGVLTALAQQWFGANDLIVSNEHAMFPRTPAFSIGGVNTSWERLGVIALIIVLAAGIYAFFRFTATGLAIHASATDRDVASLLGVSARQLSIVSWVSGSMVAGVAGIALASLLVSSNPSILFLLSIKGFAAAIVGGLVSFPIAVLAGFGIGVGEELVRHYIVQTDTKLFTGAPEVVTLGAVIITLALKPKWIFRGIRDDEDSGVTAGAGATDFFLARLIDPVEVYRLFRAAIPNSRNVQRAGRMGKVGIIGGLVVLAAIFPLLPLPGFWTLPVNLTLIYLLIMLSFVVVVGWLGQISLAEGAFVAVGGAGAALTANTLGLPFPFPIIGGVLLSIPISILVGLPALRLRGLHLAVATMAFGLAAERAIVPRFDASTYVRPPHWLEGDTAKYYVFLVLTVIAFAVTWRISRTRVGRSFFAIRDSETVAAAYGIRPVRVKLTGFVVSGAIAALAGTMITYQLGAVSSQYASVTFSILWLGYAVVAGLLSTAGPIIGALLFGLLPELTKGSVSASSISFVPQIISALLLVLIMAINPEGLASMSRFVRSRFTAHAGEEPDTVSIDDAVSDAVDDEPELTGVGSD